MKIFLEDGFAIPKGTGIGQYTLNLFRQLKAHPKIKHVQLIKKPFLSRIPLPALRRFLYIVWLNSWLQLLLRRENINIIHFTNYLIPIVRLSNAKYVVTIHDLTAWKVPWTLPPKYVSYIKRATTHAVKRADLILTVSNTIKDEIITLFEISDKRIYVVFNTIAESFWTFPKSVTSEATALKNRLGIKKDFLLFVGTIEERKNVLTLVKAFERVRNRKDIQLVLVGHAGYGFWKLYKYLEERNLKRAVILTGYIPEEDLVALYDLAIAFVYPSLYEGFGIPLVEAMARGTPIIASRIPSTQEIVAEAAVYYDDPFDHESLAEQIIQVLENDTLRQDLVTMGLKRAQTFSWEKVSEQYFQVYQELLGGGKT